MNKIWSQEEKDYLRNNAGVIKDAEMAIRLTKISGRAVTIQSVRKQRHSMGIKKKRGRGRCEIETNNVDKINEIDEINEINEIDEINNTKGFVVVPLLNTHDFIRFLEEE